MPSSTGGSEFYPGRDLSVLQLLQAARKKLQDVQLGGRCVWTATTTRKTPKLSSAGLRRH